MFPLQVFRVSIRYVATNQAPLQRQEGKVCAQKGLKAAHLRPNYPQRQTPITNWQEVTPSAFVLRAETRTRRDLRRNSERLSRKFLVKKIKIKNKIEARVYIYKIY